MTHFLRDKNNKTIIETDAWADDMSTYLDASAFGHLIIGNPEAACRLVNQFALLQDVRGEWHETNAAEKYKTIQKFLDWRYRHHLENLRRMGVEVYYVTD